MKKSLLLTLFTALTISASAEVVNLDLRGKNISLTEAIDGIDNFFNTAGTTFQLKDYATDDRKIKHYVYQQYKNNTPVDNPRKRILGGEHKRRDYDSKRG